MKKILVINQYYAPDLASTGQYAADICAALAAHDFDVYVITGMPSYSKNSPNAVKFEIRNKVKVHRVPLGNAKGREDNKTRIKGYLRFLVAAWKKAQKMLQRDKFDIILTFHNPPFVGLLGALLAKKYKLKFVYVPYDIHPDILIKTGWKIPKPFVYLWELFNNLTFNTAEKVIVLGEAMKKILVENKRVPEEKVKVISLWAKPEIDENVFINSVRKEFGIGENEIILLHAGNMGTLYPLDFILDSAKELRNYPVKFLFIGDGIKRKFLMERAQNEDIRNVFFLPFQPEDKFLNILGSVDVCLITIGKGLENLAFPSKTFTFLSAGKPIIALMSRDAEIAQIIKKYDCGWNVINALELTSVIIDLIRNPDEIKIKGLKAKQAYEKFFNRKEVIKSYIEILKNI